MTQQTLIASALALFLATGAASAKGHDQSQAASSARGDTSASGDNVEATISGAQGLGAALGERPTGTPPGQAKKAQ